MNSRILIENLTLSYHRHPAVHHVSGEFAGGSLTAITGPNGAGKSTLLKAIAGMLIPKEGKITLQGFSVKDMGYLPQTASIRRDFPMCVLQMLCTGHWRHAGNLGSITAADKEKAQDALKTVGLEGFGNRGLSTLSSGQLQRALFARLMLQDAKLILLDEPFNAIDEETTQKLLEIIHQWHTEGRTIISVVHDKQMIKEHFPQCLLIARECIGWGSATSVLCAENLEKTHHFHEAWQPHSEVCEQ